MKKNAQNLLEQINDTQRMIDYYIIIATFRENVWDLVENLEEKKQDLQKQFNELMQEIDDEIQKIETTLD